MSQWTREEVSALTAAIRRELPGQEWTDAQTRKVIGADDPPGTFVGERSSMIAGPGGITNFKVMGKTVLLNGKDISGHLGSRIINGDVTGQATLGDQSPITTTTTTSNYLSIGLTVGLTLAATLTIQAAVKAIRKHRAKGRR